MARHYHFTLPYKILSAYLRYGKGQLQKQGVWAKIPVDLQAKWNRCLELEHPLRVTADDLDAIDDKTWTAIASKLGLMWSEKK